MKIKADLLKIETWGNIPRNWLMHAHAFYHASLIMIEALERKKLSPYITQEEVFLGEHAYKVAIYLLSHALELSLKGIISAYNQQNPNKPLKPSEKYSHGIYDIFMELLRVGAVVNTENLPMTHREEEILKLVDQQLKWKGRYFSPLKKDIPSVIQNSFTQPDANGLIESKLKIKYLETHKEIQKIYQDLLPKNINFSQLPYLVHSPLG